MNKREVDRMIPMAYEVLKKSKIVEDGEIKSSWRGQISTFGAAISMGSVVSAYAFFSSNKSNANVDRKILMEVIEDVLIDSGTLNHAEKKGESLMRHLLSVENKEEAKENIINATVAIKLAANLFQFKDEQEERSNG